MNFEIFKFRSFCNGEDYRSQKLFIYDAVLINAAFVITTGTILSGYILFLGASDFLSALINNSASFSSIMCVFSFLIFEKISKRKNILIGMNLISRTILMSILILPLVFKTDPVLFVFLGIIIVTSDIIFSIYRVGWLVWLMDTAPEKNRMNYIYMRMFYLRCAFSIATLASGFLLDMFDKGYTGFVILFGFSYLLSVLDIIVLKGIREKKYDLDPGTKNLDKIFVPLKVKKYREFLIFMFLFYFTYSMAASYTPVFMIRYLEFDYKFILSMSVLSYIAMILSNLMWMKIEKEKGSRYVLVSSSLLQAFGLLILGFLTKETYYLFYFSAVLTGLGASGFNTTSFSYRYELMPKIGKTIYESWFFLVFGFSTLIAPFVGKLIINIIPEFSNSVFSNSKMQILYFAASGFLCISILFSYFRKEETRI